MKPAPSPQVLANPRFRRLFTAQVIALVGTGMSTVALSLLAFALGGAQAAVILGAALALKMVAYVFFAPVFGGLAHRLPRRPFLVTMDLIRAAVLLALPWVDALWQVLALIFLLNLCAAGFKPVFSATIADLLPDEAEYTRALALSRLAYDLEALLSPVLAGAALLLISDDGLFALNALAFLVSAVLVARTLLPAARAPERTGTLGAEILFGVRAYLATPRLRGLLALYLAVAGASAMVIVNTVVYVRDTLGASESMVAIALGATGAGSMLTALAVPRLLEHISERRLMLSGAALLGAGLLLVASGPGLGGLLAIWVLVGAGLSLIQTPAGRVINRSAAAGDRAAYFSAHFSLSHACWLVSYLLAGALGAALGTPATALLLGLAALACTVLAAWLWPRDDRAVLEHHHRALDHDHLHTHDSHHDHPHAGWEGPEPHRHRHHHRALRHAHDFVIDTHHPVWPDARPA